MEYIEVFLFSKIKIKVFINIKGLKGQINMFLEA